MRGVTLALLIAVVLAVSTGVSYAHEFGHTTEDHTAQAGPPLFPGSTFETVVEGPGAPRVVRALPNASATAGRSNRRLSLTYFAQLTDFQLVDEESPARGVRGQGPIERVPPPRGVPPVGGGLQLPPAQHLHAGEPARAGARRPRADGPGAPDRRPVRQPAVQRDGLGASAD